jgi:hypothetical protein
MGLILPITCGICYQKFTAPAMSDLLTTDAGRERLGSILETLVGHIRDNHKQVYQLAGLQASQLLRLLCLMQFQTEDKTAIQLRDFMRYQLWLSLQKNRPGTDDELSKIVEQSGLTMRDKPRVLDLLKKCRDVWCEMGEFQPQPIVPTAEQNGKPQLVKP